jgi:hypothetical protein
VSTAEEPGRRRPPHPAGAPAGFVRFAHPSERLFASLLDIHGLTWAYEPVAFPLRWGPEGTPTSAFRPDFWLPDLGCFVELTTAEQRLVTRKNAKVRRMRMLYPEIRVELVYRRAFEALCRHHGLALDIIDAA